ncbi:hypothetical protein AOPFMNJM_3150 [Methylobacterium jeotgali]|uniref:Uncharacterized protein n=1 Tax=Methylobacterium jeotgali TaxID=381630 RepID=A0ABQ4T0S1_9HYPH|nr:hypothetical protein AOPFMNJM_3150 [Methylobacterium jeotgali]
MRPVEGPHVGAHRAELLVDHVDDLEGRLPVVDADADELDPADAGRAQHVEAGAVAVVDPEAEACGAADLVDILVDDGDADALRQQHLGQDLPEAAEADHQHPRLGALDHVRGGLLGGRAAPGEKRVEPLRRQRPDEHGERGERHGEARRRRIEEAEARGDGEQDEGELARRRQDRRAARRVEPGRAEQPEQARHQGDLEKDRGHRRPDEKRPGGFEQTAVDRHADAHEEQAQQHAAEGLDVGLELVAEVRFGEQDAGEERPHGHGQPDLLHQERGTEHHEEGCRRHHLAGAARGEQPEERVEAVAADEHHRQDRRERLARRGDRLAEPGASGVAVPARRGQQRHQRQDRHDGEVLEQQHREGAGAVGRAEVAPLLQELQRHRCGRKGERDADHQGGGEREAEQGRRPGERGGADEELRRAEAEDVPAHRDELREVQLQPDDEEQQHHADLGDARRRLRLGDEGEPGWADQHPGHEIAEHRALAEQPEDRHADHRRRQEGQHRRQEARVFGGTRHHGPRAERQGERIILCASSVGPLPRRGGRRERNGVPFVTRGPRSPRNVLWPRAREGGAGRPRG